MSRPLDEWSRALLAGIAGALLMPGCGGGGGGHQAPAPGPSATPATAPIQPTPPPPPTPPTPPTPPSVPTDARHTATLKWSPVRRKTDGKRLSNLAGYRLYYGTSPGAMSEIVLANPKVTTYRFTQLSPGTWYFAVAAYTADGVEGLHSNVVSKTVR